MPFATTAREAWSRPSGFTNRLRRAVRNNLLFAASRLPRPPATKFVRCLYGHAVFPENANSLRAFLRTIKQQGEFIDTATLLSILRSGEEPDGRFFHLSFDDGFANVLEAGGEIFVAERVPWTMFVATDLVEAPVDTLERYFSQLNAYAAPVRIMSWDQVRAVAEFGGEIGCHTRTHARLSQISGDPLRLADEILGARKKIESETGRSCTAFAWPYGTARDIDASARRAIADAGFDICFSAVRGRVEPGVTLPMDVPRHQVEYHWPMHERLLWASGFREP
ncbi:MAG: polysaccharide deacetylase family protein [Sphingomonas sp.]